MEFFWAVLILAAAPDCQAAIRFAAFGDWGQDTGSFSEVKSMLQKNSPSRNFTLLLGDNFYGVGVTSVNDPLFRLFTDLADSGPSTPYHVVLGNHDYMGNVSAQIEYSAIHTQWDMPSNYYKRVYQSDGVKVCLFMIDTVKVDTSQVLWLSENLGSDDCSGSTTWRIVAGHYPIWSAGIYYDSTELKTLVLPLLHQHKVHMYLCGHEHLHEVFSDGQIVQIVSGATAQMRAEIQFRPHSQMVWGVSGPTINGYLDIHARKEKLDISVVSAKDGSSLGIFEIQRSVDDAITLREIAPANTTTTKSSSIPTLWSHIVGYIILCTILIVKI
jgi:tartrate-resistant acid phosphatase type 5